MTDVVAEAEVPTTVPPDEGPSGRPSVKEGFGFAATSFAVNVVVGMLSALLTARVYGVHVIGQYAIATAPWLTTIQFSSVAEQVPLTRRVSLLPAHHRMVAGLFLPILLFSLGLTFVAGIPIMLLSAAAMHGPMNQPGLVLPALTIVVAYCFFDNTSWNIDAVLSGFRAGRELFYARLAFVGGFLVFAVAFSFVDTSIWALTFATVASFVVSLGVRLVLLRRFASFFPDRASLREGFRELPDMLRFAVRIVGGRIAGGLNSQADTWILGSMVSVALVGAYSRASGLAVRMNDAGYRVNEILFPTLTERYESGDRPGFERILLSSQRLTAIPLAVAAGAGGGAAAGILGMFGPGFARGAGALAFLLVAYSLTVICMIQGGGLLAAGRPGWSTWVAVARLVVSVGLMVPFAHLFGATGVGAALFVGCVVVAVQAAWYLRRAALSPASTGAQLRTVVVVALVYAAAFAAARVVDLALPGVLGAAIAVAVGCVAALPVALLPGGVTPTERRSALGRLRRPGR
jgi:O-antigen/teichoic acid export membrane protein